MNLYSTADTKLCSKSRCPSFTVGLQVAANQPSERLECSAISALGPRSGSTREVPWEYLVKYIHCDRKLTVDAEHCVGSLRTTYVGRFLHNNLVR